MSQRIFTVATYNIRHGADVNYNWDRLASHIRDCDADMVGLQEVDMGTARSRGCDTMSAMKQATGLEYAIFIPATYYDGGEYGLGILSRYPMTKYEVFPLDAQGLEPRACGHAVLDLGGEEFHFFNTHLTYGSAEVRTGQFMRLHDLLPTDAPFVLTGDFNTEDFSTFLPLLHDGWDMLNRPGREMKTFRRPPLAIDNIVYNTAHLELLNGGMIDSPDSDHNLLWAKFSF